MYFAAKKLEKVLSAILLWMGGICIGTGTVITCVTTFMRYLGGVSFMQVEELVRWIILFGTFILFGYVLITKGNVTMTVVYNAIKSEKVKSVLDDINTVLMGVLGVIMAKWSIELFIASKGAKSLSGKLPMRLGYSLLPIGMIILVVYVVLIFILKYAKPKDLIETEEDTQE